MLLLLTPSYDVSPSLFLMYILRCQSKKSYPPGHLLGFLCSCNLGKLWKEIMVALAIGSAIYYYKQKKQPMLGMGTELCFLQKSLKLGAQTAQFKSSGRTTF